MISEGLIASPDVVESVTDRILFITSDPPSLSAHSGYSLLPQYLGARSIVRGTRRNATSFPDRCMRFAFSRLSASSIFQLSSLRLEWDACKLLKRGDFRAAHILWADSDWGFLGLTGLRRKHRLFATFHHCADTLPLVLQFPKRLAELDLCVLMSDTQIPFFRSHGVPQDRIHVIRHGVDTDYFQTPSWESRSETFRVLSVGSYRRNFDTLKQLCESISDNPLVQFNLVIPRAYHSMFQPLKNVRCFSGLSDEELLQQYQQASCFLMTCENATANNAVLEAMACGLPVVAERVGGIPEYTSPDGTLFANPGSILELQRHILDLCASPEQVVILGRASRAQAETLSWPRVAKTMVTVYNSLLS